MNSGMRRARLAFLSVLVLTSACDGDGDGDGTGGMMPT
jgi:hypothetical protein